MAEVGAYDTQRALPDSGVLYFFFDHEHIFEAKHDYPRGWKVLHYGGNVSTLQRMTPPETLPADEVYRARELTFTREMCLPYYFPFEAETLERLGLAEELTEAEYRAYWRLQERLAGTEADRNRVIHRLLGHADPVQNGMQLECQLEANGVYDWKDPRVESLKRGALDWRLLLQIDTDDDGDRLIWGDCGRIYYWIRQQDLQRHFFDDVWLILQSS